MKEALCDTQILLKASYALYSSTPPTALHGFCISAKIHVKVIEPSKCVWQFLMLVREKRIITGDEVIIRLFEN